jgi:hypothetical protein
MPDRANNPLPQAPELSETAQAIARGRKTLALGHKSALTQSEDSHCGGDVRVGAHGPDLEHPPQRR